ncbi:hypothetical protein GCM10009680_36550 [Streptomyces yatensis]|uniref:Uncharacterized protein n=1 Tax=Streptomyces yatensis TaxID=155177 RepID=A0ABN2HU43_9ACTN
MVPMASPTAGSVARTVSADFWESMSGPNWYLRFVFSGVGEAGMATSVASRLSGTGPGVRTPGGAALRGLDGCAPDQPE